MSESHTQVLPVVPLRDMVVFPRMKSAFVVGRPASVAALQRALEETGKRIFLVAQRDPQQDEPGEDDIYTVGVVATILQHVTFPNGTIKVGVEGVVRGRWTSLRQLEGSGYEADVEALPPQPVSDPRVSRYLSNLTNLFQQFARLSQQIGVEGVLAELRTEDPDLFADTMAAALPIPTIEKQKLLEVNNPLERLQRLNDLLDVEVEKLNIDRRLNAKVKKQMEKAQREYYLSEKIKAINEELGRADSKEEFEELGEEDRGRGHAEGGPGEGALGAEAPRGHGADVRGGDGLPQLHRLAAVGAVEEVDARDPRHQAGRRGASRLTTTAWRRSRSASWSSWRYGSS